MAHERHWNISHSFHLVALAASTLERTGVCVCFMVVGDFNMKIGVQHNFGII